MPALLFVSYSGLLGGAERVLVDCAEAISGEHILACPEGPLAARGRLIGLRVIAIPERRLNLRAGSRDRLLAPARLAGHALEIGELIRNLEPEVTVAWGMRSGIACALASRGRRFVFSHHDFLPGASIGAAVRYAAAQAELVLVPSRAVAADLDPAGRLGDQLRIVYPGVEIEWFADSGEAADPPEVLTLGALAGWKRLDLALEICARVRQADPRPQLRMRFVGGPVTHDDPLPGRLRERAGRPDLAGAVEFAGSREDPRPDLRRATCLLHCTPREPFGLVLLEAMASARPVIAPDAGGPREILDRSCGVLYPPGDVAAGAAALQALLADPDRAREMGRAGRERARSQFGRSRTLAAFAQVVGPLLHPRSPRGVGPEQLTLVTVTHDSAQELPALMTSVRRHLPGATLIVVDCASQDDSVAVARAWAGTQTIELGVNVGFGRACNRGLSEVKTPVTALVNPDVELLDDSLLVLAGEIMRAQAPERLLAPLVLNRDGTRQHTVHPVPAGAPDLVTSLLPPALVRGRAGAVLAPWRSRRPRRVGWAVGAALVARTATLRRLGPFDESIFLFGEDLELGLRAAQSGVQTWFWPGARVLHQGAHTTLRAFGGEPFERLARARHDAVALRLGPRRAALDDRAQAVTFASRIALKRMLGRSVARERRQLSAIRSMRSHR